MEKRLSIGDVVAIGLASAAAGGLLVGLAIAGNDGLAENPIRTLASSLMIAFIGGVIGTVIAGPIGIALGLGARRLLGESRLVASLCGGLTSLLIYGVAYWGEGFSDPFVVFGGAVFCTLGAAITAAIHRYIEKKAEKSGGESEPA